MAFSPTLLGQYSGDIRAIGWTATIGPLFVPVGTKFLTLTVFQNQANTGGKSGFGVGSAFLGSTPFALIPGAEAGSTFEGLPPNVQRVETWAIMDPPSGTWIVMLWVNQGTQVAGNRMVVAAVHYWGTDTLSLGVPSSAVGISGTSPSINVASHVGDLVIDAGLGRQNCPMNTGPGETLFYSLNFSSGGTAIRARMSSKPGASLVNMVYTGTGGPPDGEWAQEGFSLQTPRIEVFPDPTPVATAIPTPTLEKEVDPGAAIAISVVPLAAIVLTSVVNVDVPVAMTPDYDISAEVAQ